LHLRDPFHLNALLLVEFFEVDGVRTDRGAKALYRTNEATELSDGDWAGIRAKGFGHLSLLRLKFDLFKRSFRNWICSSGSLTAGELDRRSTSERAANDRTPGFGI
jgi:hypothetical protein